MNHKNPVSTMSVSYFDGDWIVVIEPVVQTGVHLANHWGNKRWSSRQQSLVGLSEVGAGFALRRDPHPWVREVGRGVMVEGCMQIISALFRISA